MDMPNKIAFNYSRRYGAEFEFRSFDKRDFKTRPLEQGELPKGISTMACTMAEKLRVPFDVRKWGHTHNNNSWVLKPDSSCGIEVCTPVLKGWVGIKHICEGMQAFLQEKQVSADEHCGFHLHVDVSDCSSSEIANIIRYWIKSEVVFLDSVPPSRKRNRYCQQMGYEETYSTTSNYDADHLIAQSGNSKYFTLNTYHLAKGSRKTVEFRIGEGAACVDPFYIKNWIRLLVHFVESAKVAPKNVDFTWYDPDDLFKLLKFNENTLSPGMTETRNWFIARIKRNQLNTGLHGIFSNKGREIASKQIEKMIKDYNITDHYLKEIIQPTDMNHALFNYETAA